MGEGGMWMMSIHCIHIRNSQEKKIVSYISGEFLSLNKTQIRHAVSTKSLKFWTRFRLSVPFNIIILLFKLCINVNLRTCYYSVLQLEIACGFFQLWQSLSFQIISHILDERLKTSVQIMWGVALAERHMIQCRCKESSSHTPAWDTLVMHFST